MLTRLFFVLEKLIHDDGFAANIYRLLVYFLIEWHDDQLIRDHIMANFTDIFKQERVLALNQLVEPLCSIILMNLEKLSGSSRTYLTMNDFSFFWELASRHSSRISVESAISMSRVMQLYMLKRDP